MLDACRTAKVTGAGFHTARGSATAAATANGNRRYFRSSRADLSVTARTADGTGSGYFSGDHFDVARLDAQHIADQAVEQGGAIAPAAADRARQLSRDPRAASGVGSDWLPHRRFDARTADEGRSAFSAKDGKTRLGETMFNERLNLYSDPKHAELPAAPAPTKAFPRRGCRSSRPA